MYTELGYSPMDKWNTHELMCVYTFLTCVVSSHIYTNSYLHTYTPLIHVCLILSISKII